MRNTHGSSLAVHKLHGPHVPSTIPAQSENQPSIIHQSELMSTILYTAVHTQLEQPRFTLFRSFVLHINPSKNINRNFPPKNDNKKYPLCRQLTNIYKYTKIYTNIIRQSPSRWEMSSFPNLMAPWPWSECHWPLPRVPGHPPQRCRKWRNRQRGKYPPTLRERGERAREAIFTFRASVGKSQKLFCGSNCHVRKLYFLLLGVERI